MSNDNSSLTTGIILLFIFGGLFPLMMNGMNLETDNNYFQWVNDLLDSGLINLLTEIPFGIGSFLDNIISFFQTQIEGFTIIPAVIGLPLAIIIMTMILYGLIKLR